jgi:hypothetical protein
MATEYWQSFCDVLETEVDAVEYGKLLEHYSFVLCVQGGGIDPSPKAWQAMLHGAIPIMIRSTVASAYSRFPVVVVDEWAPDALTRTKLQAWRDRLAYLQDDPGERGRLVRRLSLDYWWTMVTAALEE